MELIRYIKKVLVGIWRLMQGMHITMLNFLRPKVTEQYPENRGKHEYFERFRALLTMPHDENNRHKCTACGICMNNCPNGTITVISRTEEDQQTGKSKRVLDRHMYDLGSCTFCALCTSGCPFGAIEFVNLFEHSVFTKERLVRQLNRPGSSLAPKQVPAVKAETVPVDKAVGSETKSGKVSGREQADDARQTVEDKAGPNSEPKTEMENLPEPNGSAPNQQTV